MSDEADLLNHAWHSKVYNLVTHDMSLVRLFACSLKTQQAHSTLLFVLTLLLFKSYIPLADDHT